MINRFFVAFVICLLLNVTLRAQIEAYLGTPVGVGCVVLKVSPQDVSEGMGLDGITVFEQSNRIFYPVVEQRTVPPAVTDIFKNARRPIGRFIGDILEQETSSIAVYFLFDGRPEPLHLNITTRRGDNVTVVPQNVPLRFNQLLDQWWTQYNKNVDRPTNDFPPAVSNYLQNMLSWRLGLQRFEPKPTFFQKHIYAETGFQLEPGARLFETQRRLFFEPEPFQFTAKEPLPVSLGDMIQRETGRVPIVSKVNPSNLEPVVTDESGKEHQEKPKTTLWSALTQQFTAAIVGEQGEQNNDPQKQYETEEIEPMAFHVPSHCFYIRFGTFGNFLWFQDTTALWGGDLRNLVAMRAFQGLGNSRFEEELALKQNELSKLFGDSVIDDIAIIGTDLYFDEGGAFGLLFKAKNNAILANDFIQKRKAAMQADKTIEEKILDIDGHKVSFLTTPDHHVRSFYVTVGDYHLVSRSEQLTRDFLALHTKTEGISIKHSSLGELQEFHDIREIMPPTRDDTIFLYFSRPYFYHLTSAPYWIESHRRDLALTWMDLLKLGTLAAMGEGWTTDRSMREWIELLISQGYIPPSFGPLPDGSRIEFHSWSEISDSVRGYRGTLVPIADNLAKSASETEVRQYQQMCQDFFTNWGNLDPLAIALKHTPVASPEGMMEQITIDIRMAPLSRKNGETLREKLGPPMTEQFGQIDGNIASFEVALKDKFFFGGLQNSIPNPIQQERPRLLERITSAALLQGELLPRDLISGYMGYSGTPGELLQLMDIGFQRRDDAAGYARGITGGWRRHFGPYTLYSQQRELLDRISPLLLMTPAPLPGQFRLDVKDLSRAKITPILNNIGFARTRNSSKGNVLLLNQLYTQLHVDGPECKNVAEELLHGVMICPLGGEYQFRTYGRSSLGYWTSTALEQTRDNGFFATQAPAGFVSPPLDWLRGAELDALVAPDAVSIHIKIKMLLH